MSFFRKRFKRIRGKDKGSNETPTDEIRRGKDNHSMFEEDLSRADEIGKSSDDIGSDETATSEIPSKNNAMYEKELSKADEIGERSGGKKKRKSKKSSKKNKSNKKRKGRKSRRKYKHKGGKRRRTRRRTNRRRRRR